MKEPTSLPGSRRELTQPVFEELAALQCEVPEILGYIGTTPEKLDRWCRRTYHMPLEAVLPMVRQDGLIEIRRASFDALRKSAALIQQQYNRFLSAADGEAEKAARATARQVFSLLNPGRDEVKELFEE